jgi:hypothetical protein
MYSKGRAIAEYFTLMCTLEPPASREDSRDHQRRLRSRTFRLDLTGRFWLVSDRASGRPAASSRLHCAQPCPRHHRLRCRGSEPYVRALVCPSSGWTARRFLVRRWIREAFVRRNELVPYAAGSLSRIRGLVSRISWTRGHARLRARYIKTARLCIPRPQFRDHRVAQHERRQCR